MGLPVDIWCGLLGVVSFLGLRVGWFTTLVCGFDSFAGDYCLLVVAAVDGLGWFGWLTAFGGLLD